MYKNHCKKQHSVRLPSFWSTINGAKLLQKTARRALPLFSHLTFFTRSSESGAKPLQKTAHRATTLVARATQRFHSPQPQLQSRCKTIAKAAFRARLPSFHVLCYSSDFCHLTPHCQRLPTHAQRAPRRAPRGSRWGQDGPKRAQRGPRQP